MSVRAQATEALERAGFKLTQGEDSEWYARVTDIPKHTCGFEVDTVSLFESGPKAKIHLTVALCDLPGIIEAINQVQSGGKRA